MNSGPKPGGRGASAGKAFSVPQRLFLLTIFCLVPGSALTLIHQATGLFGVEPLPSIYFAATYILPSFAVFLAGAVAAEVIALLPFRSVVFKIVLLLCLAYAGAALVIMAVKLSGDYDFTQVAPAFIPALVVCGLMGVATARSLKSRHSGIEAGLFGALLLAASVAWLLFSPEEVFLPEFFLLPASALFLILSSGVAYRVITTTPKAGMATSCTALVMAVFVAAGLLGKGSDLELNEDFYQRSAVPTAPPRQNAPNIILIVWDTARRDHLSVYGYHRPTTPNLEKFAEEAVVYTNAFAVAPWTVPTHASMFTGLYPRTHGAHHVAAPGMGAAFRNFRGLSDNFTTLAEKLAQNGYQCGGVSANFFNVSRTVNMQQGFQYFDDRVNPACMSMSRCELCNRFIKLALPLEWYFRHLSPSMVAGQVNELALKWLDSTEKDRPFFLFLNYMEPHIPYYPPPELIRRFPGFREKLADKSPLDIWRLTLLQKRKATPIELEHLISQYDAELVYLDGQFEALLKKLRRWELYHNSLIILTSDHGEFLGEHNLLGHNKALYSEVLEIPLVIKYPESAVTGTNDEAVENRELFHLILNYLGIGPEAPGFQWDAIAEFYPKFSQSQGDHWVLKEFPHIKRAVFFGNYKLISSTGGREELYDLKEDPAESENLVENRKKIYKTGKLLLERFTKTVPEFKKAQKSDELNPQELRKLKALGYIR